MAPDHEPLSPGGAAPEVVPGVGDGGSPEPDVHVGGQAGGSDGPAGEQVDAHIEEATPEPAELLTLADGLPEVIATESALLAACERLGAGTGPVAIDAERASGYRYSQRAYLIQLRRNGSGSALIDPIAFDSLAPLAEVLAGTEWILHAATQDLPCLAEIGLFPTALFDTELAGRLLGYPRVGLGTLVEVVLGFALKKEHSAADWSTRPLPESWLEYAALDVEVLVELRDALGAQLQEAGKAEWARQEFEHLLDFRVHQREDAWRRTSGLHRVRGRRPMAIVREMWLTRDELARQRDVTPGRILPDAALVAAALALRPDPSLEGPRDRPLDPIDRGTLMAIKGFHGRGADRYAPRWVEAVNRGATMAEQDLPARTPRIDGPPPARAWAERDTVAAERLRLARESVALLAEEVSCPVENLLTPDTLRRVLWSPPATREPGALLDDVVAALQRHQARGWQIGLIAPVLVQAILLAEQPVPTTPPADQPVGESEPDGVGVDEEP